MCVLPPLPGRDKHPLLHYFPILTVNVLFNQNTYFDKIVDISRRVFILFMLVDYCVTNWHVKKIHKLDQVVVSPPSSHECNEKH